MVNPVSQTGFHVEQLKEIGVTMAKNGNLTGKKSLAPEKSYWIHNLHTLSLRVHTAYSKGFVGVPLGLAQYRDTITLQKVIYPDCPG